MPRMRKRKNSLPRFKDPSEMSSPEELAAETARALDVAAAHYAHALYWHKDFQTLAELDGMDQTEQDRIFNELVVGCIVLVMLGLEAPDLRVDDDLKGYLKELRDAMPAAHARYLEEMGVESKYLNDWTKLINMRFEEYARDRHDVRAAAMKLRSQEADLDLKELSGIQLLVPLQAVAIGAHHHICRGKSEGNDELFKCILKHLSKFYVHFRAMMEGRKITPLTRARVAVHRWIHSLWSRRDR
jgi:hypothetical protein